MRLSPYRISNWCRLRAKSASKIKSASNKKNLGCLRLCLEQKILTQTVKQKSSDEWPRLSWSDAGGVQDILPALSIWGHGRNEECHSSIQVLNKKPQLFGQGLGKLQIAFVVQPPRDWLAAIASAMTGEKWRRHAIHDCGAEQPQQGAGIYVTAYA